MFLFQDRMLCNTVVMCYDVVPATSLTGDVIDVISINVCLISVLLSAASQITTIKERHTTDKIIRGTISLNLIIPATK